MNADKARQNTIGEFLVSFSPQIWSKNGLECILRVMKLHVDVLKRKERSLSVYDRVERIKVFSK